MAGGSGWSRQEEAETVKKKVRPLENVFSVPGSRPPLSRSLINENKTQIDS